MKPSLGVIFAAVSTFAIIITAFVVLTLTNHPTDFFVQLLTVQTVPAIAAILGLVNYRKIMQVQSQTNGTTSALTDINARQSSALGASVPVEAIAGLATVKAGVAVPPAAAIPAV